VALRRRGFSTAGKLIERVRNDGVGEHHHRLHGRLHDRRVRGPTEPKTVEVAAFMGVDGPVPRGASQSLAQNHCHAHRRRGGPHHQDFPRGLRHQPHRPKHQRVVAQALFLHQVGKPKVPTGALSKPRRLNAQEAKRSEEGAFLRLKCNTPTPRSESKSDFNCPEKA